MHASFPAHGSSVTLSVSGTHRSHPVLAVVPFAAPTTVGLIHYARCEQRRRSGHLHRYWRRPPSGHRPHVSISWALPQALAAWGILPAGPCGGHLLHSRGEDPAGYPVPAVRLVRREDRTLCRSPCGVRWLLRPTSPRLGPVLGRLIGPCSEPDAFDDGSSRAFACAIHSRLLPVSSRRTRA